MNSFIKTHTHSLMSAAVFAVLVALNVLHQTSPTLYGVAAVLMAGMHLDGYAAKYLDANSARADTISHLASAIGAGLQAWSESQKKLTADQTPTWRGKASPPVADISPSPEPPKAA